MLTLASHLATIKTTRCGIIPYTIADGSIYFLLTRDKCTNELGDFGGGVKKSEFALMAAFRELHEESHGIFSHIYRSANDISNNIAIVDGHKTMAVIFVPLATKWLDEAQQIFIKNPPTKKKSDEVSELVWMSEQDFISLINGKRVAREILWTKIQTFFKRNYEPQKMQDLLRAVVLKTLIPIRAY